MLLLFLFGGICLSAIFIDWRNERAARQWESLRSRAYEYFYRAQYDDALVLFRKAREKSRVLGKSDYHYAISLMDLAKLLTAKSDFTLARQLLVQSIDSLARASLSNQSLANSLLDEELTADCQLADLDLVSAKDDNLAWHDCENSLALLNKRQFDSVDTGVLTKLCQTLILVGDFYTSRGNAALAQTAFTQAREISSKAENLSYLTAKTEKRVKNSKDGGSAQQLEDAVAAVESALHSHKRSEAWEAYCKIDQSKEMPDAIRRKVKFMGTKFDFADNRFESEEKNSIALLSDRGLENDETRDSILDRMSMVYRQCGRPEDLLKVLKMELEIRKKMYGAMNAKVADVGVNLVVCMQQLNKVAEAKPYCREIIDYYRLNSNDSKKEIGKGAERIASVLIRNGDFKIARDILLTYISEFLNGSHKNAHSFVLANYDLAALCFLEGKDSDCRELIKDAETAQKDLGKKECILVSEALRDWSVYLRGKKLAGEYMTQSMKVLAPPEERRDALREAATIADIEKLALEQPKALSAETRAHINLLRNACKKYPPIQLTGFTL